MKFLKKNSVAFKSFCTFALDLHTQGRLDARHIPAGFFYAPDTICGSVPPCGGLMAPLPLRCKSTGKAEPFFYFSPNKHFLKMTYTEKDCFKGKHSTRKATPTERNTVSEIKQLHAENRQSTINGLMNRSVNQLINDFLVEMDAKNKAYYFILEHGHFDAFKSYCQNSKKQNV
jgi:hypothetical protein